MKLRSILPLSALAALALRAAAADPLTPELTSTQPIVYDDATKEVVAAGGARLVYGDTILTADHIRYNQSTGVATARGHIVVTRGSLRLVADEGRYTLADGQLVLQNPRAGNFPYYLTGRELTGDLRTYTLSEAVLSYGEPGGLAPTVRADTLTVAPDRSFTARRARFKVGPIPLLALPTYASKLSGPAVQTTLQGGYRGRLGPYLDARLLVPAKPGLAFGADLGLFGKRGAMVGPAWSYTVEQPGRTLSDELSSGWIHDFGDRGLDLLGRPIRANRGLIEWRHAQLFDGRWSLNGRFNYWSDSEVARDFARSSFRGVQEPDSFLEGAYLGDNWTLSAFLRVQPNHFHRIQRREPEIRFDLLPTALPGGFVERAHAGLVRLQEDDPATGTELSSRRIDAFYGLERPTVLAPWLTVTPVAGARVTHYFEALGGRDTYTRSLGQLGADLRGRLYGVFDVQNKTWGIDGLRHLVEPFVQYRWLPRADRGRAFIPAVDRDVFATRLRPLDLGDIRMVDDLQARNTLRLGLDQRLQTRDAATGSRDLVRLIVAQDFQFDQRPEEPLTSALNVDLAVMPARWLQFDAFQRIDTNRFSLAESNTGVTIRDADFWAVRVGTQFLRDDLEEYGLDVRARLNERFSVTGRWRYDARERSLYEQTYGLRQNFRDLWAAEYQVSFYEGRQREGGFHFRVLLEVMKF